jgi:hypothetical protein
MNSPETNDRMRTIACLVICAFGVLLRLWRYSANRSLWFDEALLALNIVHRPFARLLQPLDNDQGAPIAFLFSEKALIDLFGNKDYVLRLFPLVAGTVAIFLMWKVVEDYVGGIGAKFALLSFAICEALIYYASEVKQYSSDVLACLLLLAITPPCLDGRNGPKSIILFGFLAGAMVWFSHPAVFVISAIFVVLLWDASMSKEPAAIRFRRLASITGAAALCGISFFILFLVSLRFLASNVGLLSYWQDAFMPIPPWQDLFWFLKAWYSLLNNLLGLPLVSAGMGTVLFIVGCVSLFLKNWKLASVLISPLIFVLAASGLHKYPFSGRLMLFSVPILLLIIAEGFERARLLLGRIAPRIGVWGTVGLASLLLYAPLSVAVANFSRPPMKEDIKPAMSYLHRYRAPAEVIYVYHGAVPAFEYYAAVFGFQKDDYIVGTPSSEEPETYMKRIDMLKGREQAWFIFSHICSTCRVDEQENFLKYLDKVGTRLAFFQSEGASVYSYGLLPR